MGLLPCSQPFSHADQFGTAPAAKAVLERAVAAVKADKDKAIELSITSENGFQRS